MAMNQRISFHKPNKKVKSEGDALPHFLNQISYLGYVWISYVLNFSKMLKFSIS
jgi:hypothetical protein